MVNMRVPRGYEGAKKKMNDRKIALELFARARPEVSSMSIYRYVARMSVEDVSEYVESVLSKRIKSNSW